MQILCILHLPCGARKKDGGKHLDSIKKDGEMKMKAGMRLFFRGENTNIAEKNQLGKKKEEETQGHPSFLSPISFFLHTVTKLPTSMASLSQASKLAHCRNKRAK